MLRGFNGSKFTFCSLNKVILILKNDVPLGFFFLTWTKIAFKFFFVLFRKRICYNLSTDIVRKPKIVLLISWYKGISLPPPPQPHSIN
jgi:hypothetical protein